MTPSCEESPQSQPVEPRSVPFEPAARDAGANLALLRELLLSSSQAVRPAVSVPSMINPQEQTFLQSLAASYFTGSGLIIDAGAFLGASTNCLRNGLRQNPAYRTFEASRIVSLDLCRCDEYMANLINTLHGTTLRVGDDFSHLLEANVSDGEGDVDLRVGDIRDQQPEDSVEILFLDVCKSPAINDHVLKAFFPKLIPGLSVVIHQDFVHESLPWIHVSMGMLSEYFDYVGVVGDFGPSAVYLCRKPLPTGLCDIYPFASVAVLRAAFASAVAPLTEVQRYFTDMAFVRLLAGRGLMPEALAELDRLDTLFDRLRETCAYLPPTAIHRARLDTAWARA